MSKPITVTIPHDLGRAEARKRIEGGFNQLTSHIGAGVQVTETTWIGDRLSFALKVVGQAISGDLEVGERDVRLDIILPGILGMIAGKLKGRLQKEGQVLLENKKS